MADTYTNLYCVTVGQSDYAVQLPGSSCYKLFYTDSCPSGLDVGEYLSCNQWGTTNSTTKGSYLILTNGDVPNLRPDRSSYIPGTLISNKSIYSVSSNGQISQIQDDVIYGAVKSEQVNSIGNSFVNSSGSLITIGLQLLPFLLGLLIVLIIGLIIKRLSNLKSNPYK